MLTQPSRSTVVVVDDTDVSAEIMRRHLVAEGYEVEVANDGPSGLEIIRRVSPDLVLLDVMMPGMNGFDLCRLIKSDPATCLTPVVLVTGLDDRLDRIAGVRAGADDYLTKPVDIDQLHARVRALLAVKRYTDELDTADGVILNLARAVDARDPYTKGHCDRVLAYAMAMAEELALGDLERKTLRRGALLHDVGKIGVPDAILLKMGPLDEDEAQVMKRHTTIGDDICGDFKALRGVRAIVRHHHERLDGSGYPDALTGDGIPFLAQIVGIVDVFDALTTSRPYRAALPVGEAIAVLREESERGLRNPTLVDILVGLNEAGRLPRGLAREGGPGLVHQGVQS